MEDILEVYTRPHDKMRPMVCLDEISKQLTMETPKPLPAKPGFLTRTDYEYKRNGTRNMFMLFAPLRGFVSCGGCCNPLTAAWSKGKYQKYPYYKCQTKGCADYGKSLPRAKVEGQFEEILKELTPSQNLVLLIKEMVGLVLEQRKAQFEAIRSSLRREVTKIEASIDEFLNRIVETQNISVITAYENKIGKLERDKFLALEKLEKSCQPKLTQKEFIELPLRFLANPWKLWASGNMHIRKMVLRLALPSAFPMSAKMGF